MSDVAVFAVALAGFAFTLGIQVGVAEKPECAPTVDGRHLIATDGSRCVYERPVPYLLTLSPTELRRMARAREKSR